MNLWIELFELDDLIYLKIINAYKPRMQINAKFAFKYLIRFLELWGMRQSATWIDPQELAEAINRNADLIASFNQTLIETDIDKRANDVKQVFSQLEKVKNLGPTGVSKVLHLVNPKFFVMWDGKIAKNYQVQRDPEGYLKFMAKMQKIGKDIVVKCSKKYSWKDPELELTRKYGKKPLTKLLDEYNWLKTRKWLNQLLSLI